MKINIGPYKKWFGPYQCAHLLMKVGVSKETCDKIAEKLPIKPFEFLDSFKKRKIKIRIDRYDTWSMDHTLALIILPMLIQLKETKHGAPVVDDEDVPEYLRSSAAENFWTKEEHETDDNFFKRWDWVLDEMIHAFTQLNEDWEDEFFSEVENEKGFKSFKIDTEGRKKEMERIRNGLRLFGKYYMNLWD